MKKIIIIIMVAVMVIACGVWVYFMAGDNVAFFDNYVQNFSDNLLSLRLKFEQKKAEKPSTKKSKI